MSKFIVTMKHYDNFSGLIKDSITANDFETAKKVFDKWVKNDKKEWNPNGVDDWAIKETAKTYMATLYNDFGLEYTKITITAKKEKPTKIGEKFEQNKEQQEDFYYKVFILGYDLLQKRFINSKYNECDRIFEVAKRVVSEFYNSDEFLDFTKSEYEALREFLETDTAQKILKDNEV